jgi:murein DD-endopeptidase MepM/ murein hydrolase activator NlpD
VASAPVALGIGGVAAVLLISGIQGKSIGSIIQGDFGTPPDPKGPELAGGEGLPEQKGANAAVVEGAPAGLISPFRKMFPVVWGRSDQGVDGTTIPGSPMVAMGSGVVTIEHDPSGFGANYPVLHISGDGAYYYGHCVPSVSNNSKVQKGQVIAHANTHGQGNATTPGAFEIGKWPPGSFSTAGASIRKWFIGLPRV